MTSALVGHHWKDNWRYWKHLPKYRQQMVRESRLPTKPPPCPKYKRLACRRPRITAQFDSADSFAPSLQHRTPRPDRKSTRLNSSHVAISYAVFCLKKKKNNN